MGKRIIVTSGPTNEKIDDVMKITNMSTGYLGSIVAEQMLLRPEDEVDKLYYLSTKMTVKPMGAVNRNDPRLELVEVESTDDLLRELTRILTEDTIDLVVHSAAVGDYKTKYTIRAEDLVDEIHDTWYENGGKLSPDELLSIFENPRAVQNSDTKISSYEPHLMTMLTLTPKVIGSIKKISPDTKLVGFKLLDKVSREELLGVASRLREKNNADFIVANDLSKIGNGKHWAMIVGPDGVVTECQTKLEIADKIIDLTF